MSNGANNDDSHVRSKPVFSNNADRYCFDFVSMFNGFPPAK